MMMKMMMIFIVGNDCNDSGIPTKFFSMRKNDEINHIHIMISDENNFLLTTL
jgi:hypothetical protein